MTQKDSTEQTNKQAGRSARWRKICLGLFLISLPIIYCSFMPCLAESYLYSRLLFFPRKYPVGFNDTNPIVQNVRAEDVWLTSADGAKLHGWYFNLPSSKRAVLLSHGNGGNITCNLDLVSICLKEGLSVFAYDYQGFGKSEGSPSVDHVCEDARTAYDYLTNERKFTADNIVLFGRSLGTGMSCDLASHVPCAGIILEAPFSSMVSRAKERFSFLHMYPQQVFPRNGLDNVAALTGHKVPVLILHGDNDLTIPIEHGRQLFASISEPKALVEILGAGHGSPDLTKAPNYLKGIHKFMSETNKTQS